MNALFHELEGAIGPVLAKYSAQGDSKAFLVQTLQLYMGMIVLRHVRRVTDNATLAATKLGVNRSWVQKYSKYFNVARFADLPSYTYEEEKKYVRRVDKVY